MIVDIVLVILLVLFGVRSFRAGLGAEMLGTVGWIVAILAAIGFSEPIGEIINKYVPQINQLSPYLSFIIIVIVLRLLFGVLVKLIPDVLAGPLSIVLNLAATVLGFFKGAFFISVVLLLLTKSDAQATIDQYAEDSVFYPHLLGFSKQIVEFTTDKVPNLKEILKRLG